LGSGLACGALSGFAIASIGLQPFVATLAMMAFARGLAKWATGGAKVVLMDLPRSWEWLDRRLALVGDFAIPAAILPALACVGITLFLLRRTTIGMGVYATGDNEQAARYAGVPVRRVKVVAYSISGLAAAIAG